MKKEKTVKTHTRKTKSGKTVTVKQHTAKYDAADMAKDIVKKAGAGAELEKIRKARPMRDPYEDFDFTKEEFAEWYEGTGSKADKKVEKALRKALGKKAYDEINDAAADGYKKGGAHKFFESEIVTGRSPGSQPKKSEGKKADSEGVTSKEAEKKSSGKSVSSLRTASSIHKYTKLNRFEEGNTLTGKEQSDAVTILEKEGYKQVGDYLVPPKDKGPLYWNTKHGLAQAGYDDVRDLYTGHNVLKGNQRKTMEGLGYFGTRSSKEKSSKEPKVKEPKSKTPKASTAKSIHAETTRTAKDLNKKQLGPEEGGKLLRKMGFKKEGAIDSYVKESGDVETSISYGSAGWQTMTYKKGMRTKPMFYRADEKTKTAASKPRKKKKNTPEQDAALDATLAEIRERNKQPYQFSK